MVSQQNNMKTVCFLIPVKEDIRVVERVTNLNKALKNSKIPSSIIHIIKDDDFDYEINEGSLTSNCSVIISKNPNQIGKGSAVKYGLSLNESDLICIIDSDESISSEEVIKSCELYNEGTFLYGVRIYHNSSEKIRRVLGVIQNLLANLISLKGYIQDTQCPLKIIDKNIAKLILDNLKIKGGMYDVQMFKIIQEKLIPLKLYPTLRSDEETSILRLRNIILGDFFDLIKIRFQKVI